MTASNEHAPALFQTDLAQRPFPEVLAAIYRHREPGTIECRRDDELKRIFVDEGRIIFATSNRLEDSLGNKLLREGKITREQFDESVNRLEMSRKRQGAILAEMNALAPRDLFVALRDHLQELVSSVFSWDRGSLGFIPGRDRHLEAVKTQIAIPQAIIQGVRQMPDARSLVARLGSKLTVLEQRTASEAIALGNDEQHLVAQINGKRTLFELVNTPPLPAAENARILYALFALDLIGVKASRAIKVQLRTEGGKYST